MRRVRDWINKDRYFDIVIDEPIDIDSHDLFLALDAEERSCMIFRIGVGCYCESAYSIEEVFRNLDTIPNPEISKELYDELWKAVLLEAL